MSDLNVDHFLDLVEEALASAEEKGVRRVASAAGVRKYGQRIGSVIVEDAATPSARTPSAAVDRELLKTTYMRVFAEFSMHAEDVPAAELERMRPALARLEKLGLITREGTGKTGYWQAWETYDDTDKAGALATFNAKVPDAQAAPARTMTPGDVTPNLSVPELEAIRDDKTKTEAVRRKATLVLTNMGASKEPKRAADLSLDELRAMLPKAATVVQRRALERIIREREEAAAGQPSARDRSRITPSKPASKRAWTPSKASFTAYDIVKEMGLKKGDPVTFTFKDGRKVAGKVDAIRSRGGKYRAGDLTDKWATEMVIEQQDGNSLRVLVRGVVKVESGISADAPSDDAVRARVSAEARVEGLDRTMRGATIEQLRALVSRSATQRSRREAAQRELDRRAASTTPLNRRGDEVAAPAKAPTKEPAPKVTPAAAKRAAKKVTAQPTLTMGRKYNIPDWGPAYPVKTAKGDYVIAGDGPDGPWIAYDMDDNEVDGEEYDTPQKALAGLAKALGKK